MNIRNVGVITVPNSDPQQQHACHLVSWLLQLLERNCDWSIYLYYGQID